MVDSIPIEDIENFIRQYKEKEDVKPEEVENCFENLVDQNKDYRVNMKQWYDMVARYNTYSDTHDGVGPLIIAIKDDEGKCTGDYISQTVHLNMWNRYWAYTTSHGEDPNWVSVVPLEPEPTPEQPAPPSDGECVHSGDKGSTTPLCQPNNYCCSSYSCMQVTYQVLGWDKKINDLVSWALNTGNLGYEGAGHEGLANQLNHVSEGNLAIKWYSLSSVGGWEGICKVMRNPDKSIIIHNLLSNQWGHYSTLKVVDCGNSRVLDRYSVGDCQDRIISFATYEEWIRGITWADSIGVVYKV
jgi:hypothetical protein